MRARTRLLIFVSVLTWAGCIDTAEPTGPIPAPPPDDGGELAPLPGASEEAQASRTSSLSPGRRAN